MDEGIYLMSNLKYLRKTHKKTLQDIAKAMGKSCATIHYWETGQREMYAIDLWNMAKFYNVNVNDLVFTDLSKNEVNSLDIIIDYKISSLNDEQKKKVIDMIDIIK